STSESNDAVTTKSVNIESDAEKCADESTFVTNRSPTAFEIDIHDSSPRPLSSESAKYTSSTSATSTTNRRRGLSSHPVHRKFSSPERRKELDPEEVLKRIEAKQNRAQLIRDELAEKQQEQLKVNLDRIQ